MRTDGGDRSGRSGRYATEVAVAFVCRLATSTALGLDHGKGFEVGPSLVLVQTVDQVEGKVAACFDPPVIFLDGSYARGWPGAV